MRALDGQKDVIFRIATRLIGMVLERCLAVGLFDLFLRRKLGTVQNFVVGQITVFHELLFGVKEQVDALARNLYWKSWFWFHIGGSHLDSLVMISDVMWCDLCLV